MLNRFFLFLFMSLMSLNLLAQDDIPLNNPSFEGSGVHSTTPKGWYDCGQLGQTPPDMHPTASKAFEVTTKPLEGKTFMGLVVRANETWEGVSQRLASPMTAGEKYKFSCYLARSNDYWSASLKTEKKENYNTPIKVRLWGGNGPCSKKQLLDESKLVKHTDWKEYVFEFKAESSWKYFYIEAFYKTPSLIPYNGNILIDNCSPIIPVNKKEDPIAAVDIKKDPKPKNPKPKDPEPKEDPVVVKPKDPVVKLPADIPAEKKQIKELDKDKIEVGQKIRIDQLYFTADSVNVEEDNYGLLDEIYVFLARNRGVKVEIGGHTNGTPPHDYCDRLSKSRAKAVADYLIDKGIAKDRIEFKGYGKRDPLADNDTASGRKKNQRVEIKILSIGS